MRFSVSSVAHKNPRITLRFIQATKKPGMARLCSQLNRSRLDYVATFVMLCNIETFGFLFIANTQAK